MRRTIATRRAISVVGALALMVAACGGDDDDAATDTRAPATEAEQAPAGTEPDAAPAPTTGSRAPGTGAPERNLAAALADDILNDGSPMTDDPAEARCVADAIVDGVGEERLRELGMTPDDVGDMDDYDFTEGEFNTIVDALFGCVDVRATLATSLGAGLPPEQTDCIAGALDEDTLRGIIVGSMGADEPPPEFINAVVVAMGECGALAPMLAPQFAQMGLDAEQADCVANSLDAETMIAMANASDSEPPPELMRTLFVAFDDCGALVPMLAGELASSMEIDDARATCVAEQLNPDVMVEMAIADMTGASPSEATIVALGDAMVGCDTIQDALAQQFVDENGLDLATAQCVVDGLDADAWRSMFVAGVADDAQPPADVVAAFEAALAACEP